MSIDGAVVGDSDAVLVMNGGNVELSVAAPKKKSIFYMYALTAYYLNGCVLNKIQFRKTRISVNLFQFFKFYMFQMV